MLLRIPARIVWNEAETAVQTVGNEQKTVFTTTENAAAWLPLLGATGHQVRAIESIQELRSLLWASGRDGIDEVALDPQPGTSDFKSIHIAFFLEHLDGTLRGKL